MACPCTPEILRDGQSINGTTKKKYALIGQRINLSIGGCGGYTLTDITWTIPGTYFDEFLITGANQDVGDVVPCSSFNDHSSISFCWADAADNRTLTVTFKINNQTCTHSVSMDVKKPSVIQVTKGLGTVQCYRDSANNHPLIGLRGYGTFEDGILVQAKVNVDLNSTYGFSAGEWNYVDLITNPLFRGRYYLPEPDITRCENHSRNGQGCLDGVSISLIR